jgi:hypothetical protein
VRPAFLLFFYSFVVVFIGNKLSVGDFDKKNGVLLMVINKVGIIT